MNKHQKRKRVLAKKHRQRARRRGEPVFFEAESPVEMLKNFLPEASPEDLARVRRERERKRSPWQRLKQFFGVG